MTYIGPHPPPEMYAADLEIDCQCARCGSSCDSDDCECVDLCYLDEDGNETDDYDYDECDVCDGWRYIMQCMSSPEWCEANPLPGREGVERGKIEWFTIQKQRT